MRNKKFICESCLCRLGSSEHLHNRNIIFKNNFHSSVFISELFMGIVLGSFQSCSSNDNPEDTIRFYDANSTGKGVRALESFRFLFRVALQDDKTKEKVRLHRPEPVNYRVTRNRYFFCCFSWSMFIVHLPSSARCSRALLRRCQTNTLCPSAALILPTCQRRTCNDNEDEFAVPVNCKLT